MPFTLEKSLMLIHVVLSEVRERYLYSQVFANAIAG